MKKFKFIIFLYMLISNTLIAQTNVKLWDFNFTFGINLDKGNTERIGCSISLDIKRSSKVDKFIINMNAYYSESENKKDKNKGDFTLKYDYDFLKNESFFIFILPSYNEFQNLKLRMQNGIGLKHTFYKTSKADYSLSGALIYELKQYLDVEKKEEINRLSLRPKIKYSFNKGGKFYFVMFYQPKIDEWQDYRILSEFILEFNIYKNLFFEFKVTDEYNNIVLQDIKRNDLSIMNSIKLRL